jgi:transcription initiation factor TFIIIB Brf1 subunit/transcription initiation factor TFIIB
MIYCPMCGGMALATDPVEGDRYDCTDCGVGFSVDLVLPTVRLALKESPEDRSRRQTTYGEHFSPDAVKLSRIIERPVGTS